MWHSGIVGQVLLKWGLELPEFLTWIPGHGKQRYVKVPGRVHYANHFPSRACTDVHYLQTAQWGCGWVEGFTRSGGIPGGTEEMNLAVLSIHMLST